MAQRLVTHTFVALYDQWESDDECVAYTFRHPDQNPADAIRMRRSTVRALGNPTSVTVTVTGGDQRNT